MALHQARSSASLLLLLLSFLAAVVLAAAAYGDHASGYAPVMPPADEFSRKSFPKDFIFGAGSAAYQYEGAWNIDGKGPSIWDTFTHDHPEKILEHGTGDVADDFYHRYKEDIANVKFMNMDAFRFSISWSRILPTGRLADGINEQGVEFYNNVIDECLAQGIQPLVTLYHWDTPQGIEDQYKGFLGELIVKHFTEYADLLFDRFGDRVKHWVTFNEPYSLCSRGYETGTFAPGRCSSYAGNCTEGNSGTEPYLACHNLLNAHASAVRLYREKYQAKQKGIIGITLVTFWFIPYSNSAADVRATKRSYDFIQGWFMDPIHNGHYPKSMRTLLGNRLPKFTPEESMALKGSYDFVGLNYYTTYYVKNAHTFNALQPTLTTDSNSIMTGVRNGVAIGPQAASSWLYIYPEGIKDLALFMKRTYNDPLMYITENGIDDNNDNAVPIGQFLMDGRRVAYHRDHIKNLAEAIKEGARVQGYFAWSKNDDFEWDAGYTVRFGLYFIDYKDNLKRIPKQSAYWFKNFLA